MKLGELVETKRNFPEADFWLRADGEPVKTYDRALVGVKVTRTDVLVPQYLYYFMVFLKSEGAWRHERVTPEAIRSLQVQEK
jgi:hypothetical protein